MQTMWHFTHSDDQTKSRLLVNTLKNKDWSTAQLLIDICPSILKHSYTPNLVEYLSFEVFDLPLQIGLLKLMLYHRYPVWKYRVNGRGLLEQVLISGGPFEAQEMIECLVKHRQLWMFDFDLSKYLITMPTEAWRPMRGIKSPHMARILKGEEILNQIRSGHEIAVTEDFILPRLDTHQDSVKIFTNPSLFEVLYPYLSPPDVYVNINIIPLTSRLWTDHYHLNRMLKEAKYCVYSPHECYIQTAVYRIIRSNLMTPELAENLFLVAPNAFLAKHYLQDEYLNNYFIWNQDPQGIQPMLKNQFKETLKHAYLLEPFLYAWVHSEISTVYDYKMFYANSLLSQIVELDRRGAHLNVTCLLGLKHTRMYILSSLILKAQTRKSICWNLYQQLCMYGYSWREMLKIDPELKLDKLSIACHICRDINTVTQLKVLTFSNETCIICCKNPVEIAFKCQHATTCGQCTLLK